MRGTRRSATLCANPLTATLSGTSRTSLRAPFCHAARGPSWSSSSLSAVPSCLRSTSGLRVIRSSTASTFAQFERTPALSLRVGGTTLASLNRLSRPSQLVMSQLRRSHGSQAEPAKSNLKQFWERWIAERPQHPRWSFHWWWDMFIIFTVFGITGSSTMFFVRPVITKILKLEGSMKEGPWSYRLGSVAVIMPMYSIVLMCIATLFGRHAYFKKVVLRMWSRFLPKSWIRAIEGK